MNELKPYIKVFLACVAAVLLDCAHFTGPLHYLGLVDFCLCLLLFGIIFFDWVGLLMVTVLCGLALDFVSFAPEHTLAMAAMAAAGRSVSRLFISRRSVFNLAAQLMILATVELVLYLMAFYPFTYVAPRLELWLLVAGVNAGLCAIAVLAAPRRRKFEVHKL